MFQLDDQYTKKLGRGGRTRTTTDEQFTDSYNEQGIQPTYKESKQRTERASEEDVSDIDAPGPSRAETARRSKRYRERVDDTNGITDSLAYDDSDFDPLPPTQSVVRQSRANNRLRRTLATKETSAAIIDPGTLVARIRVSGVNVWLMGWGLWLWISFQIPLAIISMVMFGIGAGLESFWVGRQIQSLASAISEALEIFGIDLSIFSPYGFAFIATLAILAIGMLTILSSLFAYSLAFINGFGGRGSSAKTGALLICILGYGLPLFNFFPWFVLYLAAVWRYPK